MSARQEQSNGMLPNFNFHKINIFCCINTFFCIHPRVSQEVVAAVAKTDPQSAQLFAVFFFCVVWRKKSFQPPPPLTVQYEESERVSEVIIASSDAMTLHLVGRRFFFL